MSSNIFKGLKAALEEAIAHSKGELDLVTKVIDVSKPTKPITYKPKEIKKIRARNNYTQKTFAHVLNVSVKTVQSWESGQRVPSHAALRLLELVDKGIYNP